MIHVQQLEHIQLENATMVAIGVFDGVHRGHQTLIKQLVTDAHAKSYTPVVLTFHPHPDVVLRGISGRYYLTTPEQRAHALGAMGVEAVVTHPFNESIRTVRAADFVDKLVTYLNLAELRVGKDFALGYQREGNVAYLTTLGHHKGYTVHPIDLVKRDDSTDQNISSSAIRSYLKAGAITQANHLLGRAYQVEGIVVQGDQRGRTIGFPTANMAVWEQQMLPANGVYAGWVQHGADRYQAVTNVGVRPTFSSETLTVEPHLLDFDRDIYGEHLTLTFEHRLRGEQKFDGLSSLKTQLAQDIAQGRALLTQSSSLGIT